MRRVSLYKVYFNYILGNYIGAKHTSIYLAHESVTQALDWLISQHDYPACTIERFELIQENILIPEKS